VSELFHRACESLECGIRSKPFIKRNGILAVHIDFTELRKCNAEPPYAESMNLGIRSGCLVKLVAWEIRISNPLS